jgi:ribonuclease HI
MAKLRYSTARTKARCPNKECITGSAYLGAECGTNNTGELIGIIQAIVWLRADAGHEPAAIAFDSEYAAKVAQGIYKPKKNMHLPLLSQGLVARERARRRGGVTFIHV